MRPQQTVPAQRTSAASPPGAIPSQCLDSFEVTLPAANDAPVAARAAVTAWTAGQLSDTMLADVQLLLSELVTNSVRHADAARGGIVRVRARIRGDALRLEVQDAGKTRPIARRAPDRQHGGGFGLHVVEALSRRWGVSRDAGTCVWAELALPATVERP
jgi:anti-sigma regulatory factor (Ser/Thr protein kinase)